MHVANQLVDCKMGDIMIYDKDEESEIIFILLEDQKPDHQKTKCMILSGCVFHACAGTVFHACAGTSLMLSGIIMAAKPLFPNF